MVQLGKLVESVTIPARHGRAVVVRGGQKVKVTDVEGKQVCDFFALRASDPSVYLSGVYTRSTIARMRPRVGDTLFDNHRIAIMSFLEDTTIGIHDMLYAPCDPQRYLIDYEVTEHRSCKVNVLEALATLDVHPPVTPEVFNIFQNSGPDDDGNLSVKEPVSHAGDYVVLLALDDLIVAGSACPQDLNPCNGFNPSDLTLEVYD